MSNSVFGNRKAQITVFMIIGIVLVIGALVYFGIFFQREAIAPEEERGVEVPLEVKPVKDFVESCVLKIGVEALKLVGQHGGYIYPLERQDDGRVFTIDPLDPSSSDGVSFTERAESSIVYWWYMKSPNSCNRCLITTENIPKIDSIERQVDKYIAANLGRCLDGFVSFERSGFDVSELGQPVATTKVTAQDVVVSTDLPLRISLSGKTTDMDRFITHIPINLTRVYALAREIALTEANDNFLEYLTKSWIVMNGGLHTNMLPPTYAIEDSYAPKIWIKEVVEMQLKDLFTSYVLSLQVNQTKGARKMEFASDRVIGGAYSSFFLNLLNSSYDDYSVRFYYLGWPMYLHITPDDNGVLRAARVTDFPMMLPGLAAFIAIKPQREYEFFYDVSYPVVVELRNKQDLFGEGFTWLLALEVNLRDTRSVQEWFEGNGTYGEWDYSWVDFNIPQDEIRQTEHGANLSLATQNYTKSLFCSPKQMISGNVSVVVKDALNSSVLEDVSVKYSCGRYDSCFIGRTAFDLDNNATWLLAKFPVCVGGGIIELERSGHKSEMIIDLTTIAGKDERFEFEMVPIFVKNVTIKKLPLERVILYREPLEDHGNNYTRFLQLTGEVSDPVPGEESMILNVRKVDEPSANSFPAQNLVIDNATSASTLKLVPGIYEVQTTYIDVVKRTILPEKRCRDTDEDCIFIPETPGTTLDQLIGGGLVLNNVTGYWEVGYDDLSRGDKIVINVLQLPPPLVIEDLGDMSLVENLSWQFRSGLQPQFTR